MLLISPGDDSASLPIDSLQHQPGLMSEHQSCAEGEQAPPTGLPSKLVSKTLDGDRGEASVPTHAAFDAVYAGDRTMLQSSTFAQSSHYQSALWRTDLPETELDGLYALRQAAKLKSPARGSKSSLKLALAALPDFTDDVAFSSYAAPLAPLRARDITALSALFQRQDIYAIEADVNHRLLSLLPEPCWDDGFTFLKEFL